MPKISQIILALLPATPAPQYRYTICTKQEGGSPPLLITGSWISVWNIAWILDPWMDGWIDPCLDPGSLT